MHRYGVLHRERISTYATDRKREFEIKGELSEPLFRLSGGNIQKVILSRELSIEPEVLVFAEPSWGLDLSTRAQLFRRLRGLRDQGTGVVLISTDLDDVLELADRIVIVRDGTIVATLDAAQTSRERIGRLMLGVE
jgi:simple sugar transport system ATP-binding protein